MDEKRREITQRDQDNEVTARAEAGYRAYAYKTGTRISLTPSGQHVRVETTPNKVSVHVQKPDPPARLVTLT